MQKKKKFYEKMETWEMRRKVARMRIWRLVGSSACVGRDGITAAGSFDGTSKS